MRQEMWRAVVLLEAPSVPCHVPACSRLWYVNTLLLHSTFSVPRFLPPCMPSRCLLCGPLCRNVARRKMEELRQALHWELAPVITDFDPRFNPEVGRSMPAVPCLCGRPASCTAAPCPAAVCQLLCCSLPYGACCLPATLLQPAYARCLLAARPPPASAGICSAAACTCTCACNNFCGAWGQSVHPALRIP